MHVSPIFKEINRRFVRMDNSMWGCPSYRSKRWSLALGMTQNHVSIPSLRQPTQDTWMSLWGPESESEILCFATAHGRTGVLDPFRNREWTGPSPHCCHLPSAGRAQGTALVTGMERTPAELHQLLGCTESFWTKTFLLRFCFSPLFCLFGMEGVCFLGTGLLPRCFLCSLSQPHGPDRGRALTVSMLPGTISRISSGILDRGWTVCLCTSWLLLLSFSKLLFFHLYLFSLLVEGRG